MFSHLQQLVWHQLARGGNIRTLSSSSRSMASPASALVFPQHGEPEAVLQLQAQPPPTKCQQGQVLVQFLAAPINPSDVNTIQGRYPIKPDLPGVPGHEGVATVVSSGPGVSSLKPGDWVVPLEPGLGTWRSHAVLPAAALHPLPPGLPLAAAAMLCVNPPTALALLQRFVQLRPGDAIIQNGATSVVGQAVIQLARARGVATINVVRPRPNWDVTVAKLKALGADVVTTEDRVAGALAGSGLPAPRLALNCIGGSQALAVAKPLAAGGVHVTYGAMGMQPVSVPAGLLIFKDIRFVGFWLSGRWAAEQGPGGKAALLDEVVRCYQSGALQPPAVREFPLADWRQALQYYRQDYREAKVLLLPSA